MTDIILLTIDYRHIDYYRRAYTNPFRFPPIQAVYPHIGLAYLAAALKEKGFRVNIVDGYLFHLTQEEILRVIIENNPKVIGMTVSSALLPENYALIKKLRLAQRRDGVLKGLKIILGGQHVSALPEAVYDLEADFGCLGEAEECLPVLCDYIINHKGNLNEIKGIIYKENGQVKAGEIQIIKDLDSLPSPAYDLFLTPKGLQQNMDFPMIPMLQTRGCVNRCAFCPNKKPIRFRSIPKMIDEMQFFIEKYHCKAVTFIDETFTFDKKIVREMIAQMNQRKIKIDWYCTTCAHFVDEALLKEMYSGGCNMIRVGVETGSERVRYSVNKRISNDRYMEVFGICRKLGIKTTAYFMVGLPSETKEDVRETISFIDKLKPDYLLFQLTAIFPNAQMYEEYIKSGKLNNDMWAKCNNGDTNLIFNVPEGLTLDQIQKVRIKAYLKFYFSPRFIMRCFLARIHKLCFPLKTYMNSCFRPRYLILELFQIKDAILGKKRNSF